ncbi:MAG: hypothetical protein ACR2HD_00105 [Solirubrobacteraceae bacterium]
MKGDAKSGRFTIGGLAAGALAIGCCAGLPLVAGVIAGIGGLAFGGITAAAVLLVLGGSMLIRRRRQACAPRSPEGPTR